MTVCAITLGIPHPPSYPLFVWLGHLFYLLVDFGRPCWRMNIFSGFCTALGVVFLCRSLTLWTGRWQFGFGPALLFAFGQTVWRQSVICEVFGLHWLLLCFFVYLAQCWATADDRGRFKVMLVTSFFMGLALAHHQTILFALPGLFLFGLVARGKGRSWGFSYYVLILVLLGCIPLYVNMMFRAQGHPDVNWGDPSTPEGIRDTFLRRAYGTFSLSSANGKNGSGVAHAVAFYVSLTRAQFPLPIGFLILVGFFAFRIPSLRAPCCLMAGWFFVQGPFFAMYAAQPADSFFIDMQERFYAGAYLGGAGLIGLGLRLLFDFVGPRWRGLYLTAVVAMPFCVCYTNWDWCSQAHANYGYDTIKASLDECDKGAIFVVDGDLPCGVAEYLVYVEKYRPDVHLVFPGVIGSKWGAYHLPDFIKESLDRAGWSSISHDQALEIVFRAQYSAGGQCMLGYKNSKVPGTYRHRGLLWQWYPPEATPPSEAAEMKIQAKELKFMRSWPRTSDYHLDVHQNFWEQFEIDIWANGLRGIVELTHTLRPDLACEAMAELDNNYVDLTSLDFTNMGLMEKSLGHRLLAERCLRRALELDPSFTVAMAGMVDLLTMENRSKEAEVWRKKIAAAPSSILH
jgi:hypothetical protein